MHLQRKKRGLLLFCVWYTLHAMFLPFIFFSFDQWTANNNFITFWELKDNTKSSFLILYLT